MVHDLQGAEFVVSVEKFKADRRAFYLSPERWESSKVAVALQWNEVKFKAGNKNNVPQSRGIYAFIVRHENNHFPPHGFIMYVGITGHEKPDRTLQKRFSEYLHEQKRNKRPKVHYMLNKYSENLFFHFVSIDDDALDLAQLEVDMNDALIPPVGRADFSAEIRALRDALE